MTNHCFISYSSVEALGFAFELYDELKAGPPSIPVWLDKRDMTPGRDWQDEIVEAIKTCDCLIFVMSPDSVERRSLCKEEWMMAISYKKPIIPILLDSAALKPFLFLLGNRQYIDFTGDFKIGLAGLRRHLKDLKSPAGEKQTLIDRLDDAKRDLRRADDAAKQVLIQEEIKLLEEQIALKEKIIANREKVSEQVQENINRGLEMERTPDKTEAGKNKHPFINRPPTIAPAYFQNRFVETKQIGDFLQDEAKRLITIAGRGGIGKTAMVCRLLKALENGHLPGDGGTLPVDGIVYLSEVSSKKINFANLYSGLTQLLPEKATTELDALFKDAKATTTEKTRALLNYFPAGRSIILLDNFEYKVDSQTRNILDTELKEALETILAAEHHGLKVIITTRIKPLDLGLDEPGRKQHIDLDFGLEFPFAENILREMDQDGKLGLQDASEELLGEARKRTMGFPRALEAFVGILANDRNKNLEEILADAKNMLPGQVVEKLVGEAFSRLDAHSQMVMQALAIYGRPVSGTAVDFLLQPFLLGIDSRPILGRLVNMHFVRKEGRLYYLHPVDRDYAISRIPLNQASDQEPEAGGFNKSVLLQRGAAFFKETRLPRQDWKNIDDLTAPLAEFELRYEAGDFDEAARVLLEIDFDYLMLWGHNQLVAHLHERLKDKISEPSLKQSSIGTLGMANKSLGEYQQAISCIEQALTIARELGDRQREGDWLGNLGNCYADLGDLQQAIEKYEQALTIARELGNRHGESVWLGNLGYRYGDLGELQRAIEYCRQGLKIANEINFPLMGTAILVCLGQVDLDQGNLPDAIEKLKQAVALADKIKYMQLRNESRFNLSLAFLYANDFNIANQVLQEAQQCDYPPNNHHIWVLQGLIALCVGNAATARDAFSTAITLIKTMLERNDFNYDALDGQGFALCGLALTERNYGYVQEAMGSFQKARAIFQAKGYVNRTLRLFNKLVEQDKDGILKEVRKAVLGEQAPG